MVVNISEAPEAAEAVIPRLVRLSAYVDLPLHEAVDRLGRMDLDQVLRAAAQDALGNRLTVRFSVGEPVWESGVHVHLPVSWTVTGPRRVEAGAGSVSLLTVRSGRRAVTELLADLSAPPAAHRDVARVTRRILDEVTRVMESESAPR